LNTLKTINVNVCTINVYRTQMSTVVVVDSRGNAK